MEGELLQTESPDPALEKEDGDVGCAMGTVGERFRGKGTWNREARRVTLLAAELGGVLDEETLILCDVRDLMALRLCLQQALAGEARPPWAILRRQATGVRCQVSVASGQASALCPVATDDRRLTPNAWSAALATLARALGYRPTR